MNDKLNSEMIHHLDFEDKKVILVGTAHVSKDSVELVEAVIDETRPDTVCVELCESRAQSIRQKQRWQEMDIIKVIKEKKAFLLLSNLMLASFQRRIADRLEVAPGQEMIQAMASADAVGAAVHLADRDIRVTLSRTWRSMGLWGKVKLIFQLILSLGEVEEISEADVEKMKQQDMLASILDEVGKSMPQLRNSLIDERDRYLTEKIRTAPGNTIVAVVGAGHVPGIKRYWDQAVDLASLESLPPKGPLTGFLKWFIPVCICLLIVYGFSRGGAAAGADMVTWWVAANGVLAGLGALIALGHPLTILSSVLAAPLTSLNPMIAAGWVSGIVEAFSRKPKVKDFESLPKDILSVKGFWRNKVTRILLVVVFTNLGSAVGTFVAIPMMMKYL
ncbi:TraB/GumN family protein [Desulfosarcina ovata]|uniref:Conjugal transfer protein TraB n=2 Tax=Desulfosarcina ovata TaxID=83564 RepID=A0A5K8AH39_9BACT|nr:TraB/GumN family protein [Desulfosarcina ovata]BBO85185.1 conjugal transfer protein TraB [Desulfosarcina ovata subsp. sediminis]BBO91941.1 conjugal transfer protein TraB [Desulfosarcina ovata subsp. ovata]